MLRRKSWLVLLAIAAPSAGWALGLGQIHLHSSLDAPLSADIDVLDASPDDLSTLKATLAPRATFAQLGVDFPSFLGSVTLTPRRLPDGREVLHVSSSGVANEPFATLLVEADWARGHVVREYTVLLNPPLFNSQTPSQAAIAAPTVDNARRSGSIARRSSASPAASAAAGAATTVSPAATGSAANAGSAAAAASAATAAPGPTATTGSPQSSSAATGGEPGAATAASAAAGIAASTYTVRPGDTLSAIAQRTYSPASGRARDRALVAIYRANPRAFDRNMNVLLAGTVLTLPGDDEVQAIGPAQAISEVRSQYRSWLSSHGGGTAELARGSSTPGGQLRLVAPGQGPASQAGAGSGAANGPGAAAGQGTNATALRQQVQTLQTQLAQTQKLLQLRSAQLAALQARTGQKAGASASAAAPAPAPAAAASAPPSQAPAAAAVVQPPASTPSEAPAAKPAAPVAAARAHPSATHRPGVRAAASASGGSMLGLVLEYWYVPAALIAAVIALLILRSVRSRQDDALDRSFGTLGGSGESNERDEPSTPPRDRSDTVPARTLPPPKEEPSYQVEESGTHQRPVFAEAAEPDVAQTDSGHVTIDEGMAGEVPVTTLDQGDPLAEADFHMAYGLYDQAAELVQSAIAREPDRRELKLKLLEVFFVWGNRERFLQSAHELAQTRDEAPPGEWEKIVIMGRQIAPEDALFADGRAVAAAASGGVDLNLEGGQNRVDFDLLGEPSLAAGGPEAGVDLDLSSALSSGGSELGDLNATDPTSESRGPAGSQDFVLERTQIANSEATGSTRNMQGAAGMAGTTLSGTLPSPLTASAIAAKSSETTREMPAAQTREMPSVSAGSEIAGDAPTVEQPQLRAGEHATIRQKLDAAARHGFAAAEQTAELAIDDLGLDLPGLQTTGSSAAGAATPGAVAQRPPEASIDADAPTMLAQVPAELRHLARARESAAPATPSNGGAGTEPATATGAMRATGTWLFTDTDFGAIQPIKPQADDTSDPAHVPTERVPRFSPRAPADASATSSLSALDASDLDLDLGALEGSIEPPAHELDLDVGAPTADGTFPGPRRGAAAAPGAGAGRAAGAAMADEAMPDLEPVTLSEVGTKLDLARAYMDMGDPEGARSILSEVITEGSVSQKQEARRLMEALPG